MYLFLALVAVPIIEIALFIQVGGLIGMVPTLVIVVITALVGTILLRGQGVATLTNLQSAVARGSNPLNEIAHGAFILVAGVLLLTPGFFTDALGISFLIPPVTSLRVITPWLSQRGLSQSSTPHPIPRRGHKARRAGPRILQRTTSKSGFTRAPKAIRI